MLANPHDVLKLGLSRIAGIPHFFSYTFVNCIIKTYSESSLSKNLITGELRMTLIGFANDLGKVVAFELWNPK